MRKLILLGVLLVIGALATPAQASEQNDYAVVNAFVQMYNNADPSLCVVVAEAVLPYSYPDYGHRVCLSPVTFSGENILVDPERDRTYARITTGRNSEGTQWAHLGGIIVRSAVVKQRWLARLQASKPPADVVPELRKK